jgi:DNA-binding NtrC family response regulator
VAAGPKRAKRKLRILMVDDERHFRRFVKQEVLASNMSKVRTIETVEKIDKIKGDIDVAILDGVFNGVDRRTELYTRVRERWPHSRVIGLTNSQVARRADYFDVITKDQFKMDPSSLRNSVIEAVQDLADADPGLGLDPHRIREA